MEEWERLDSSGGQRRVEERERKGGRGEVSVRVKGKQSSLKRARKRQACDKKEREIVQRSQDSSTPCRAKVRKTRRVSTRSRLESSSKHKER
eukprot:1965373-Pleurochrysis_carterae.AAC.1